METGIDLVVVCALEVERRAVCDALGLDDDDRELKEGRRYWHGQVAVGNGRVFDVAVTQLPSAGNVQAAARSTKVIAIWQPAALLFVGIAAASSRKQRLGDVVVGTAVYCYEPGKVVPEGVLQEPDVVKPDPVLLDAARTAKKWSGEVLIPRPTGHPQPAQRELAVIASGEKVVADPSFKQHITEPHRKIRAIEMEGYGFSVAISEEDVRISLDLSSGCGVWFGRGSAVVFVVDSALWV